MLEMELERSVICGFINSTVLAPEAVQGPGTWEVHEASVAPAHVVTV